MAAPELILDPLVDPTSKKKFWWTYTHKFLEPPSGWTLKTSFGEIRGRDMKDLIQKVKSEYLSRELNEPADLAAAIQSALASNFAGKIGVSRSYLRENEPVTFHTPKQHTSRPLKIKAFMRSTISRWLHGLVEQKVANQRAQQCIRCRGNKNIDGVCSSCPATVSFLSGVVPRATRYDDDLKQCKGCECFLRVLIFYPEEAIRAKEHIQDEIVRMEGFDSFEDKLRAINPDCWQLKILEQKDPS